MISLKLNNWIFKYVTLASFSVEICYCRVYHGCLLCCIQDILHSIPDKKEVYWVQECEDTWQQDWQNRGCWWGKKEFDI